MEKGISYLNRNFNDYRQALIDYSEKYYPELANSFNDASVGSWFVDLVASVADNLSYHIDRVYQETNIESAKEGASVFNLARNAGFKIPGPKGAMAEVRFSCKLPIDATNTNEPDWTYAPIIKRGTRVASSSQQFEVMDDIDFSKQFNSDGYSDRTIIPAYDTNGNIVNYTITKLAVVVAGESRIYKQVIYSNDIKPFMEIVLPTENIMNIESIIVKKGTSYNSVPTYGDFYSDSEEVCNGDSGSTRFFEVDSLIQQQRWGTKLNDENKPLAFIYGYNENTPTYSITRGEWKTVKHKFITEYTDKGYLKVIFGAGIENDPTEIMEGSDMSDYAKYRISKIMKNDNLGYLPEPNSTIFILYRVGGGASSNVAAGAINTISYLNMQLPQANPSIVNLIKGSISVRNTTPSVSGKDMPSLEELKYMIKYNLGAQKRCVTLKDYEDRILLLPPKYGTPFRVGAAEENNKVMIYLLGLNNNGNLDTALPTILVKNIEDYLAQYRSINDFVEIKPGRIINLSFEADLFIDKNYNREDVLQKVIATIQDYMDINKHRMGEDIFIGDLEKEITKCDGVINLVDIRVYTEPGSETSSTLIPQEIVVESDCTSE